MKPTEQTHVYVILKDRELLYPNETGVWARWNVYTTEGYKGGRTGASSPPSDPYHLVLLAGAEVRFEIFLTSMPPGGNNPKTYNVVKGTQKDSRITAKPGGGYRYIYVSRKNNSWTTTTQWESTSQKPGKREKSKQRPGKKQKAGKSQKQNKGQNGAKKKAEGRKRRRRSTIMDAAPSFEA